MDADGWASGNARDFIPGPCLGTLWPRSLSACAVELRVLSGAFPCGLKYTFGYEFRRPTQGVLQAAEIALTLGPAISVDSRQRHRAQLVCAACRRAQVSH